MWRGLAKGALLFGFGRLPGGSRVYRTVTREWMGTQASHVDKLQRVWPGYVDVWRAYGVVLEGANVWIHQGGWTPFPFLANYLVTGTAGVVTNVDGRVLDRYLAHAVELALKLDATEGGERRRRLVDLQSETSARRVIAALDGRLEEGVTPDDIPLPDASVDLCHTGGVLEHMRPASIDAFLRECRRILRPGALMSHVVRLTTVTTCTTPTPRGSSSVTSACPPARTACCAGIRCCTTTVCYHHR